MRWQQGVILTLGTPLSPRFITLGSWKSATAQRFGGLLNPKVLLLSISIPEAQQLSSQHPPRGELSFGPGVELSMPSHFNSLNFFRCWCTWSFG